MGDNGSKVTIHRASDGQTRLDVQFIKERLKQDAISATVRPFDGPYTLLELSYSEQSDSLVLFYNSGMVPRADFLKLVADLMQFYDMFDDQDVKGHNQTLLDDRFFERPYPPEPPPLREAPKISGKGIRRIINTRDEVPGFVYLMRDTIHRPYYKIGLTRNVKNRTRQIGQVEVIHSFETENMAVAEKELHLRFEDNHIRGDWFTLSNEDVEKIKKLRHHNEDGYRLAGYGDNSRIEVYKP